MPSTVLSVRVSEAVKEQLDYLSRTTKRSKTYLVAQALDDYARKNAWRARELHAALAEADKGVFTSHEAMLAWADSLGSGAELPAPRADIFARAARLSPKNRARLHDRERLSNAE
jgi:predicted transcriptional regulator